MSETKFTAAGATPLVFSVNPVYPVKVAVESGVVVSMTEAGTERAHEKGPVRVVRELQFVGLTASEFDGGFDYLSRSQAQGSQSLVNWFINVAPPGVSFSFEDAFGVVRTVGFQGVTLAFELSGAGLYDGVVALREVIGQ